MTTTDHPPETYWLTFTKASPHHENQDALAVPREWHDTVGLGVCVAVADGVSLAPHGGAVARLAVQVVERFYDLPATGDADRQLDLALATIYDEYEERIGEFGQAWEYSACSLTVAVVAGESLYLRHLGDCSCDLLLPDGEIMRVTEPHAEPDGTLYRHFGGRHVPDYQRLRLTMPSGTRLLLASDGVTGYMSPERIRKVAEHCDWDADTFLRNLAELALLRGSEDDMSMIVGPC